MAKRFHGTPLHKAGHDPALMVQCRVLNVNLVNFTVDVISQFDRHYYYDIQVSSSYLHYNNGEGIYVMPDVGAVCFVCIPSDSTPPYVSSFIMPMQQASNTSQPLGNPDDAIQTTLQSNQIVDQGDLTGTDASQGTRSRSGKVDFPHNDARFDGGRPAVKPGDICLRGRDGNFLYLHRGGVLQIGGSELAQRIYIPLANKIFDISGDYEHQNVAGAIKWGIQEGPSIDNPAAQHMETYRLFANDQFCDIRVGKGKVFNPVPEPPSAGDDFFGDPASDLTTSKIGVDAPTVYEIIIAPGGFKAGTGDLSSGAVQKQMKMHFLMDRDGGVFMRSENAGVFWFKKGLTIKGNGALAMAFDSGEIKAKGEMRIGGGPLTEITGDVVRIGGGGNPAARMGDSVAIIIPVSQVSGTLNGQPFTGAITIATPAVGSITTGNPNCLLLRRTMPAPFNKILGPLPLSACVSGALQASLALPPLLAQIQLMLSGAFGLGPLKADLVAQFNASIGISIAFGDPLTALKLAIAASASVIAALQASLALSIPPISIQVSVNIALAAALLLKIGGINLLIDLSLGIRLAGINFLAQLQAALSLGGCVLYGWSGQPFGAALGQIIGYPGYFADGFAPADTTYGVMVVTKAPAAVGAFQFMFAPGFPA